MTIYKAETFEDRQVPLDGNEYDSCTFTRCELVYAGGSLPSLMNNRITECKWTFDGAASRTVKFMRQLYCGGGQLLIEDTFKMIRGMTPAGFKLN